MCTFRVHTCLVTLFILFPFFIIFKCQCKMVCGCCLFRQWWGWLCCMDYVRYLTGSCCAQQDENDLRISLYLLFHPMYLISFLYTLFCIIWCIHYMVWRWFPIETAKLYIVLSVKPTPSLIMYQKYHYQYVLCHFLLRYIVISFFF